MKHVLSNPPKNMVIIPFVWGLLKNLEVQADFENEKTTVKVESIIEALKAKKTLWHENVIAFLQTSLGQVLIF